MQEMMRFGIDLGGTKIEIVALAPAARNSCAAASPRPRGDYRATIDATARLVTDAERELGVTGTVGIGTPGSISRATGLLRGSNSVCLNGQPIKRDLEAHAGSRSAHHQRRQLFRAVGSDRWRGRRREGGFRRDSRHGRRRRASSWTGACSTAPTRSPANGDTIRCRGRATTSVRAPACFCGRYGCIETWLAGPGLERDHLHASGERRIGAGDRRPRGDRRPGVRRDARALRGAPRARARARDQSAGSRRHCAGWRDVEHRAPLR